MPDDIPDRPAAGDAAPAPKPATTAPAPAARKGFDPANLKGGKQPGGKVMRGTRTMQSGKSRGRG